MILVASLLLFFSFLFLGIRMTKIVRSEESEMESKIAQRLKQATGTATSLHLERRNRLSDLPFLNRLLKKINRISRLDQFIAQADLSISVGSFILFSLVLASSAFFLGTLFRLHSLVTLMMCAWAGLMPFAFVMIRRSARAKKFSDRFPDAIGLLSGSLRAGHSLQMAVETVVEEGHDIVAQEFGKVLSEVELGQNFEEALNAILKRVDTQELRLFISAVMLQRETGGNLAGLLDNLESIIRQRQELYRELKAATAQARLSGIILSLLPIFVAGVLLLISPEHMLFFVRDPAGLNLLKVCIAGQVLGIVIIQRLMKIDI